MPDQSKTSTDESLDANGAPTLRLALVIPAYNEEAVIESTVRGLPAGIFSEVIVAVNGATDRTAELARSAGARVVISREKGYGAACLAALDVAQSPVMVFLQADGSEDAAEAVRLTAPIQAGTADLVIGARTSGLRPHQHWGNQLAVTLVRWFYGVRYTDLGPFRAIRTASLRQLNLQERAWGWTVEMQVRAIEEGLRVVELPVACGVRQAGEEKVSGNWRSSLRAGWRIIATVAGLAMTRRRRTRAG
ncbi:MAG: glycosyltransferase family 2 protein [Acidobacteria bacterium]|nr:glycosyltransferase family 2 protein [Acidobacteriota bacterium]